MTTGEIQLLERPSPKLLVLYMIRAILTGPGLIVAIPLLFFRYHTLRYRFDDEGIHVRWGILFRREINLAYARIQDIHLTSGLIQRWFGLADVQVQTASGNSGPEVVIEGFHEFEAIRDYLYTRMRGYRSPSGAPAAVPAAAAAAEPLAEALHAVAAELRATRETLERLAARPS